MATKSVHSVLQHIVSLISLSFVSPSSVSLFHLSFSLPCFYFIPFFFLFFVIGLLSQLVLLFLISLSHHTSFSNVKQDLT